MNKIQLSRLLAATLLLGSALPLRAALVGSSVTGSLVFPALGTDNYFDPVFNFFPPADLNAAGTTVIISNSAVEFGYDDFSNLDTADFTNDQLVVSDLVETSGPNFPFTMSFSDSALAGATISKISDSFPLSYSLTGDVLTINSSGGNVSVGDSLSATFDIATAGSAVPEPSTSAAVLLCGLAVVALCKRRVFAA